MSDYRIEKDSLGELKIQDELYYGIQTERARQNFDISSQKIGDLKYFIWSLAAIKKAAAKANHKIGLLTEEQADSICQASDEVINGKFEDAFPINVLQGGGYTSANMNMNEVLANRANEIITGKKGYNVIHPNTHVNMGQSTNDVIPAAMKLACYMHIGDLVGSAAKFFEAVSIKAKEFSGIVKLGRTCLQDAVPVTLGQEFSGYADLIERRIMRLNEIRNRCLSLPLGGTAVGTQLSCGTGYVDAVYTFLSEIIGEKVVAEANFFDGLQNADLYIDISSAVKALATGISKMATDIRMLSSGPRAGLGEITIPAVQPGSSIMPGKINPTMPELMNQICYQICGNDVVVTMSVEGGELDLNVWEPSICKAVVESCILLTNGIRLFSDKCVKGIIANEDVCKSYAESSFALSTVVATIFGYEQGSRVAKKAINEDKTIKEVCIEEKIFTEEEAEELLDPMLMTDASEFVIKIDNYRKKYGINSVK